ncbi:MAG: tetratricopeptide repeat protein, partial [Pirellulales bacterium]|nr:tetratricopeptide repeat protein [Pirellulales bacterium]
VIVAATVLAYCNTLGVPFLFDDAEAISRNPTIRQLWPIGSALSPPNNGAPVDGRPLVNLSFAVNYAIGGLDVRGYHAVNLAIHVLAALVLLGVVRRTLALPSMPEHLARNATVLAGSVALVWAVHPLQTESVTYVSQRAESLVSLFYLLTLYCTIRGSQSARSVAWYLAAVAVCVLGMASKEVMASTPVMVLLYDRTFLAGTFTAALKRRRGLYLGLAATWGLLAALVINSAGRGATVGFGLATSPWNYALTQCGALVHYLRLAFWPTGLCIDHGSAVVQSAWDVWPQAVAVVALVSLTVWSLWRRPVLGFLGTFFLAVLAPTTSVVPVVTQTVAEHRMYLPLAAVATVGVIGGYLVGRKLAAGRQASRRPAVLGVAACVLVGLIAAALGTATYLRNHDYRDRLAIWEDTVRKCPDNARAHDNLGVALRNLGRLDEAIVHFRRCLELDPDNAVVCNSLGVALMRRGETEAAIVHLQRSVELDPKNAEVHSNLGVGFAGRGEIDAAIGEFRRALELNPDYSAASRNLGTLLLRRGEPDAAIDCLRRALKHQPNDAELHNDLGAALAARGQIDEAVFHFRQALAIRPEYAQAAKNLARYSARTKRVPATLAELRAALGERPDDAALLNNLAWILATSSDGSQRNGPEAIRWARRAVTLTGGKEPVILDTLAAAYAEAGQFAEATETAREAAELATSQDKSALAKSLQARMWLYQQEKTPFPKTANESR